LPDVDVHAEKLDGAHEQRHAIQPRLVQGFERRDGSQPAWTRAK
jgi:hypothetical protein